MVDKRKPTYDLGPFKRRLPAWKRFTQPVLPLRSPASLGFGRAQIVATIQTMRRSDFYKSMTSYADHRAWQDVYHVPSEVGLLYETFTADAVTEFLLLSFKETDDA